MRQKFQHSFAKKILADSNLKFYHNGKRILEPVNFNITGCGDRWNYPPFKTEITKGVSLMPELKNRTRAIRSYEELASKTGLMISSKSPTVPRFTNQKTEYYLAMQNQFKRDVGEIPRGHMIELNISTRQARLIGRNSWGRWITYEKRPSGGLGHIDTIYGNELSEEELMMSTYNIEAEEVDIKINIKEIVVGTSLEDGRIVSIPEENFNPVIFICGKRRQGKTFLHYRLLGNVYHKWRKKCIDMIDIAHEAETHSLEWKQTRFTNWLSLIGETTRALPLVYLTPSTSNLKNVPLKDEVGFKISLPYEDILFDYESIFKGNKALEFEKTSTYFKNMLFDGEGNKRKDGLIKCKTFSEIRDFVTGYVKTNAETWGIKSPDGVISKILNCLQYLFNEKVMDISIKEKNKWTIEFPNGYTEKYNPWTACLMADLIPTINTSNLRYSPLFPFYLKYMLEDIYKTQTENELFLKNKSEIFIFLNEVSSAVYDETNKKFTVVSDILDMIIRESAPNRIGVVFGTQDLNQVSNFSKSQANYVFSFKQNESGADQLTKDYDALKDVKKDLKRLQPFECIGFPSGSPFRLYDEDGDFEEIRDEPIKMKIFPPLSAHKPPKEMDEMK